MRYWLVMLLGGLVAAGCTREPGSTTLTKGALKLEVDEAVEPAMRQEVEEFRRQYPESEVALRSVEAREAVADFINDSVRVIVCGRAFNKEERDVIAAAKIPLQEYQVAQGAVAVITNKGLDITQLRTGEIDSIFSGGIAWWPGKKKRMAIDIAIGGVNSSVNEVLRAGVMKGKRFALSATPVGSSADLLSYVERTPGSVGILGISWLKGVEGLVNVVSLGTPGFRPDSTEGPGRYYSPAQAYVFKGYYPVTTPVYIYTREVSRDIGLGFIAFVSSAPGQKIILNSGLVPVTMPVRLVQLTSEQVKR